jgi:hypothetical protein
MPFVTRIHQVQVSQQTDYIINVPCGTNSGVNAVFEKIEVVNQLSEKYVYETVKNYTIDYDRPLIFDKINYEMAQFCSKVSLQEVYITKFDQIDEFLKETLQNSLNERAPGLQIIDVRLSKPIVNPKVQENYEKMVIYETEILKEKTQQQKELQTIENENAKTSKKLKAEQEIKLQEIEAKKQYDLTQIEAKKQFDIAQIENKKQFELSQIAAARQKELARIEAEENQKLAEIQKDRNINEKMIEKDISYKNSLIEVLKIDAESEKIKKLSELEIEHQKNMKHAEYITKLSSSPGYVSIEVSRNIAANSKFYYGDNLPKYFPLHLGLNMTNF